MSRDRWKLTNEEYEFIKGEVVHIFKLHNIRCIPVSGFEIASKMGITLIPYSSFSERKLSSAMETSPDGCVVETNDGRECIYYNDVDWDYERQNYTILHEIGHIVLDHTGADPDKEEDEANFFAKYAIAPPVLVHRSGARSAEEIYEVFDVSFEEAWYAFKYYKSWLDGYLVVQRLTEYEKELWDMYSA